MPTVANHAGPAGEDATTWRACTTCGVPTANPPEQHQCDDCRTAHTATSGPGSGRPVDRGRC